MSLRASLKKIVVVNKGDFISGEHHVHLAECSSELLRNEDCRYCVLGRNAASSTMSDHTWHDVLWKCLSPQTEYRSRLSAHGRCEPESRGYYSQERKQEETKRLQL
jgi:hypothetical protein